jgi:aspartyl-tRNA(Asn)/glutamyl-tRNA(Gln) amidotransferase subunit A
MTKSLEDNMLLTEIMAGFDQQDATMRQQPADKYTTAVAPKKAKFAVMNEAIHHPGVAEEVKSSFKILIQNLENAGHEITYFDFPLLEQLVPAYYVLTTAEASSNLSRYTGMLYGKRSENAHDLESTYTLSRTEGFGPEVKRRIMLGTFVLSSDHYDAYYSKAQKVRRVIQNQTNAVLENVDAILIPTTSTPAFKLGEKSKDPIAMYLADLFTVQANLAGNPAISLPLFETEVGLPMGIQLMGKSFKEQELFNLSQLLIETCN